MHKFNIEKELLFILHEELWTIHQQIILKSIKLHEPDVFSWVKQFWLRGDKIQKHLQIFLPFEEAFLTAYRK